MLLQQTVLSAFVEDVKVEAVSHVKDGVHAGADIYIGGGQVEIMAEGDGLQSEEGMIKQYGGYLQIFTSGQKSHGMKSVAGVIMDGGALHAKVSGAASNVFLVTGTCPFFGESYSAYGRRFIL